MGSLFDADLAWRYMKERRFDLAQELIEGYKRELEQMEASQEPSVGKADALSIYGYYQCVHLGDERSGIAFCQRAVDRHPEKSRHHLILAMAWFQAGFPRRALAILEEAVRTFPRDQLILEGFREVERRRPPMVPFLSRNNRLNIFLGKLRHRVSGPKFRNEKTDQSPS